MDFDATGAVSLAPYGSETQFDSSEGVLDLRPSENSWPRLYSRTGSLSASK